MAILKRQKADGTWEFVQTVGKDVGVASNITVTDTGNKFTGTNVETVLAEIGDALVGTRQILVSEINAILNS